MKSKQKVSHKWFYIGLLAALLAVPNATIIRTAVIDIDPSIFNLLRFSLLMLVCFPFVLLNARKINKTNLKFAFAVGIFLTLAVTSYTWAIKQSGASYSSILTLLAPILFVIFSVKLNGETISPKAIGGISLAAAGAMVIVVLPIALKQDADTQIYPLATLLMLVNAVTYPLMVIYSKKANDAGLPLLSMLGISSVFVVIASLISTMLLVDVSTQVINTKVILAMVYSGLIVGLVSRLVSIASYERIGSAATSAIAYLEILLAIILPVIVLSEKLSTTTVLGGILILCGVYLVEHHRAESFKHFSFHRHH